MEVAMAAETPRALGDPLPHCRYYYTASSAPTSPSRPADFFGWEDKPASCKAEELDFAFCFYEGESPVPPLATADELFEEGMIRPLFPPTSKKDGEGTTTASSRGGSTVGGKGEERRPESAVMTVKEAMGRGRGRRGEPSASTGDASSSKGRRASRSLSPLRGGGREDRGDFPKPPSSPSAMLKSAGSKAWRLRDLFLFRSASEGRATGRGSGDPLRRYTRLPSSSSSLFGRRVNGTGGAANAPSAHELYYSANRAASEELKKKTPLPFERHGLFGCLRFNPALRSVKRGFSGALFSPK
ncbi:hypothetical protein Cni_G11501 [Canna indica]|uniref:Uncharacterized protein n=1 Tax=Canna indica TaxID=4628 RepID=A0AAQ3K690_9LILI|nr:hypothetical protein Cni_G11501 [Canna indica]